MTEKRHTLRRRSRIEKEAIKRRTGIKRETEKVSKKKKIQRVRQPEKSQTETEWRMQQAPFDLVSALGATQNKSSRNQRNFGPPGGFYLILPDN